MSDASSCYHCGLPVSEKSICYVEVKNQHWPVCCPGCKAVVETIVKNGMGNYYQYRTQPAVTASASSEKIKAEFILYDRKNLQQDFVKFFENGEREALLLLEGITCAACVWLIETHLMQYAGVCQVDVNLTELTVRLRWQPKKVKLSQLLHILCIIGYRPHPWHADKRSMLMKKESKSFLLRLAVSGIGAMQVMMYAIALYAGAMQDMEVYYRDFIRWVSAIMATPVVFYAALPFFKAAWRDLQVRSLSMDVPISLAIGGAYVASIVATTNKSGDVYFDSVCMFTFFLLVGRYLELRTRYRASCSARDLHRLLPASCLRLTENAQVERVAIQDLALQDCLRILPGETVPTDGIIIGGRSSLDESALSGEYMPVKKCIHDAVIAGSHNVGNAFDMRITALANQTRLSGIMHLLAKASEEKPKTTRLANQVASWFVGAVILVAVVVYFSWSFLGSDHAFWIMLSVLVITCPCALSLATPVAMTAATNALHLMGVLIIHSRLLEALPKVTHVIFDKTGTLTHGRLSVKKIVVASGHHYNQSQLLAIAAALESYSSHPIAGAFSAIEYGEQAENVQTFVGKGLQGWINGCEFRIGKPDFCLPNKPLNMPEDGQWLLLSNNEQVLAWFELNDAIRDEAVDLIRALKQKGLQIELLSGDRQPVVAAMADTLGVKQWRAGASPEDKLNRVRQLQNEGATVLMVGDGINDVPVLAGADVSFAMNTATDLTKTHADGVLLSSDLMKIVSSITLSNATRLIIRQNIIWSLAYNMMALPLASFGMIPPWAAAIGMSLSSLVVVGNALRLTKKKTAGKQLALNKDSWSSTAPHDEQALL